MANENKPSGKGDPKDQESTVELVAMFRENPQFEGGPTEAMVHPDEVSNYAAAGWQKK